MVSIEKMIERGGSSDGDCERGGMVKWRVNVVHMIRIMDSLKGRGLNFLYKPPTHQGSDAPWLPPRKILHMYGMHTPNNEMHNNHTQYTLRTFVLRGATVSCTGS